MLRHSLAAALALVALAASTARADDKSDLTAAINKLADAPNYTWTTTSDSQFGRGPADGKAEKAGATAYNIEFGENTYDVVTKGDKAAIKGQAGWQTPAEMAAAGGGDQGFNPDLFAAMVAENFLAPAEQLKAWTTKLENIKKTGDVYTADLPTDAAKDLLTLRGRKPNGVAASFPAFEVGKPKASLKLTVKDGIVTKMEVHSTGTFTFGDNEREIDRTNTSDIKDVGTTKVAVPDDAQKKLNAPAATAPAAR